MDMESVGVGAGGGFFATVLALFGVKQRFDRVEKDIESIKDNNVWRGTCSATHKALDERLNRMENKLDQLIARGK